MITVRTRDAIHLATAVQVNAVLGGIGLLSLGDEVRTNAALLGLKIVPLLA